MRIALLSPPWIPVPPSGYGGIEWIVSLLADELVARGHDVTLFATGDSKTSADLRYVFDVGPVAQMHHAPPLVLDLGVRSDPEAQALRRAARLYDSGKRAQAVGTTSCTITRPGFHWRSHR